MASIKTSIKQKAKKIATLKLTEQPSLDGPTFDCHEKLF
jgi:hypothetical protein